MTESEAWTHPWCLSTHYPAYFWGVAVCAISLDGWLPWITAGATHGCYMLPYGERIHIYVAVARMTCGVCSK